jgi:hypothetical protein
MIKKECSHYYKAYNRCHLPINRIELRCSSYKGCGKLLKSGYLFKKDDYAGNGLSVSQDRIVWEDGTLQDY